MSKTNLIALGVRLPEGYVKEGKKICKREGITFSHWVRRVMAKGFASSKEA